MSKEKFERLEGSRVKLEITITPEQMALFKEKALRLMGEGMKLEGFRPGKAPLTVVENKVDPIKLMMEMVDIAIKESYYDRVVELKDEFITIDTPKIDFKSKIDQKELLEKGLVYEAEVAVYPDIKLPDLKKIKIKRDEVKVTDEEYNQALASFLQKRSTLKGVDPDYKIQEGDWVDIGFEIAVGENKLSDAGSKNFPLIVGNHSMIPGFEDQLIGLKKGEEKKFDLKVDEKYREKRMAGQMVTFQIIVNEIKNMEIPVLDDKMVAGLSIPDVKTKDEFASFLKNNLKQEKEQVYLEKLHNDILAKIAENTDFDVPQTLIERELHLMWHEFEDNIKSKGIDPVDYLKKEKLDEKKIKEGWREQAEKRVKYGLIINQVVRDHKINVPDSAVEKKIEVELENIKNQLEKSGQPNWQKTYREYENSYHQDEAKHTIGQRMLMEKLFTYLVDNIG